MRALGRHALITAHRAIYRLRKVAVAGCRCGPRANGVYVYLPGGENGAADAPSDFYNSVRQRLEEAGVEPPGWTYKYNAGANPISFPIPFDRATHSIVRQILKEAYDLA